ncbi:hypothetical protein J3R80_02630 [Aliiroseovarius sp. Z3]|uniref:hypothetical protein n=1 Tax=Aliiroseovarius sp. Z3 TaxID=2811402 RepID=UPI0023B2C7A0|nr:hypothetical protein [Aliiroseovarius sp. Z3]MDE9449362.1 hypothetical protein [Aliiroseovarius sp. Z3]
MHIAFKFMNTMAKPHRNVSVYRCLQGFQPQVKHFAGAEFRHLLTKKPSRFAVAQQLAGKTGLRKETHLLEFA